MTDVNEQLVERFGTSILTQDNAITADPIYCVQERRRIYGMDPEYSDYWIWYDRENCYEAGPDETERLNALEVVPEHWERVYYQEIWEHVASFFLDKHAREFMEANAHNLGETRIYVASGYRNTEWQFLRQLLIQAAEAAVDAG